jgi:hypothetical protein
VKSSLTAIAYPKLIRANASAALAYIYRPAARRKIAARPAIGIGAGVAVTRHAHRRPASPWWDQRAGNSRLRRSDLPAGGTAALLAAAALRAAGQHSVALAMAAPGIGAAAGALGQRQVSA